MNLNLCLADALAACTKAGATVSSATSIWSGGTRLVLTNAHDSAVMARALAADLIVGAVQMTAPKTKGAARSFTSDTPREQKGWTGEASSASNRSAWMTKI